MFKRCYLQVRTSESNYKVKYKVSINPIKYGGCAKALFRYYDIPRCHMSCLA